MHTQGPWEATKTYSHVFVNDNAGHCGVICKMPDPSMPLQWACDPASTENSANARLIAAAPDLMAACQMALGNITGGSIGTSCTEDEALSAIKAAIAKAVGHD